MWTRSPDNWKPAESVPHQRYVLLLVPLEQGGQAIHVTKAASCLSCLLYYNHENKEDPKGWIHIKFRLSARLPSGMLLVK